MIEFDKWKIIHSFLYPHEAHLARTFLESEGLESEIRDEFTVQVNNFYSNAIGGVKLLVREEDFDRGIELLTKGEFIKQHDKPALKIERVFVEKNFKRNVCPFCNSENISIKKDPNILTILVIFVINAAFPIFKKSYKCYDCGRQWKFKKK